MVMTPAVSVFTRPEKKVRHLVVHPSSNIVAWSEGSKAVFIASLADGREFNLLASFTHDHAITTLNFHRDLLVIGDELEGLSVHDTEGTLVERHDIDGGVQQCMTWRSQLVGIGGMGQVFLFSKGRPPSDMSSLHQLSECEMLTVHKANLYVVLEGGHLARLSDNGVEWRRPQRGDHGERITSIGTTTSGMLFLTREGHALVPGEEEAIEFECWRNGELVVRVEQRMRLLTSSPSPDGALLGFDDGQVFQLDENGGMKQVINTGHPVFNCVETNGHILASSWFYIHGVSDGLQWKIEHQGMPSLLIVLDSSNTLLFAGDDQNDYTAPEPIGLVALDGDLQEVDEAELGLWFEEGNATPPPSAEMLYGDPDDMLEFLTEDERASFAVADSTATNHDVLIDAMGDVPSGSQGTVGSGPTPSDEDLLEALNDLDSLTLEVTDSLLDTLQEENADVFRPQANAGEDQRILAESDGTTVVHLDGRGTNDPHNMIVGWSWLNERGEELASSSQVKLRLPLGLHAFELRVVDSEGASTTDSVQIHVLESSTS